MRTSDWWRFREIVEDDLPDGRQARLRDPTALAYDFVNAPKGASLTEMAGAAGLRGTIEEYFLRAKDDLGLDHSEASSWHGWP